MPAPRHLEPNLRPINTRPEDPTTPFPYEPVMLQMHDLLKGKVAVVSGGMRGIGLAVVRTLAANGADVATTYISEASEALVAPLKQELHDLYGRKLVAERVDASDLVVAQSYIKGVHDQLGRVDILVNNAGVNDDTSFARRLEDPEQRERYQEKWRRTWVKFQTMESMSEAAWPYMVAQKSGDIASLTSVSELVGGEGQPNYNASNGAIAGLSRTMASEGAKVGIRVNVIAPGFVDTDMTSRVRQSAVNAMMGMTPLQRRMHPQEVANTVVFVVSPLGSPYIGTTFHPDGGMTKR